MRVFLIGFLLLCTSAICAADTGFDIKGVPLGATQADLVFRFTRLECREAHSVTTERTCAVPKDSYGGADALLLFYLNGGKVSNMGMRFSPKDFAGVIGAMKERFGAPASEETEIVTNRVGAKFENTIVTWKRGGEVAVARRYAGALDRASITIVSTTFFEELKRRTPDKPRERARNI
jgi:hypothetical protein